MVFTDAGITARTERRPGYQAMLQKLEQVDAPVCFQTSRLHRKLLAGLRFIAEEIVDTKKRLVFVSQNIDTERDDRWRYLVPILGLLDELRAVAGNANIRAAHKRMHAECLASGSRTFGYDGQPIDGKKTKKGKPRRRWVVQPVEAPWVKRVFDGYANDSVPVSGIIRRVMTRKRVPPVGQIHAD